MRHLIWPEWKRGEVISDNTAPKRDFLLFVKNYYWTLSVRIQGPNCKGTKNLSLQMGFVTRFLNGTSQEIKVKLDESRQLKFYQVKKTRRKFNWEFCWKELCRILAIKWTLKHFYKTKKKEKKKYSNSKNIVSQTLVQKICNTLYFPSLSFSFLLYKIPIWKTLLSVLSFRISIRTRKLRNLLFKFTVNGTLKPPKNIIQLDIKLGFSVTPFLQIFIILNFFMLQIFISLNSFTLWCSFVLQLKRFIFFLEVCLS